jgi:hypothetical protein
VVLSGRDEYNEEIGKGVEWECMREEGKWSYRQDCGSKIMTDGNERGAYGSRHRHDQCIGARSAEYEAQTTPLSHTIA